MKPVFCGFETRLNFIKFELGLLSLGMRSQSRKSFDAQFTLPFCPVCSTLTRYTGSRSTFEFPIRVNLSSPNLYCIARTLGK